MTVFFRRANRFHCGKLASGNVRWVKRAGGEITFDVGFGVAAHGNGSANLTGKFRETAYYGGACISSAGWEDIFIARIKAG